MDVCLGEGEPFTKEDITNLTAYEGECGGKIRPTKKDGRFYEFKNVMINLPEALLIPRCDKCQKDHLNDELETIINNTLALEYERHQDLIEQAIFRHKNG